MLANKIISTVNEIYGDKYKFIIFGEYDILHPNLIITGKYENENIFSMINKYDIDYFIYLSVFEETYSFTLSIAINTGLPIIYNNIGSYTERLINYNNCFPFNEENYKDIINILEQLENNTFIRKNKNLTTNYPNLYNNIPEFSDYLKIDNNYNFNIEEINKNLNNGIVCFIHLCVTDSFGISNGLEIFNDQIDYIKKSGLYDKLDYIFVTLVGKNILITHDYKIKLIYYSENILENEFPSIFLIKYFSDNISKNIKILRIHTKGVTKKPHSVEWRKYLEYFLIEKNNLCLELLDKYKCVGVNHYFYFNINKYRNHYSGNFWWSNSMHIKNLQILQYNKDRCITEHWLIGDLTNHDYRNFISLHQTDVDFYRNHLDKTEYNLELIKLQICKNLENNYIKNRKIYGVFYICCIENYLDIIKDQIKKLLESNLYENTDKILCFVCNMKYDCINYLKNFNKIEIISTTQNLYEKYAINNFRNYINGDYYLYYFHSKSVSRTEQCYIDWRNLCDYFILKKWRLLIELLNYYDCVGINLKNFPKKHFSGNFWWSKSDHINKLHNINNGYLSPEMYICSHLKTNYISIYQSYINHGNTNYPETEYSNISDCDLINNINFIPDFNNGDKQCIRSCGTINSNFEPPILELT